MKIKKYLNIFIIFLLVFVMQTIYIEYTFSKHKQHITDLKLSLDDNLFNVYNRLQQFEEANLSSKNSFVNSHDIPDKIFFCGDKINLDNPFIRESVEREFYSLLSKQGQIQLYIKRLGRYEQLIESELNKSVLPKDLKYLSIHESALLPTIRSRSRAVGLWQFMSSTAQLYGLKVNKYFDERRDPQKATIAALRYLKDLRKQFGSWPLALAAYNGGPNRVKRSIKNQNTKDFFALSLPEETERYYFKIIATKIILSQREKFGFKMTKNDYYEPHPVQKVQFTIHENRKYLDEIADICNINLATFKALNPSIISGYLPAGDYTFYTYHDQVAVFSKKYKNYHDLQTMLAKNEDEKSSESMVD